MKKVKNTPAFSIASKRERLRTCPPEKRLGLRIPTILYDEIIKDAKANHESMGGIVTVRLLQLYFGDKEEQGTAE